MMPVAPYPSEMHLFVTTACNLRCGMCGQWGDHGKYRDDPAARRDMPTEMLRAVLTDAEAAGAKVRYFVMGGEPFLRRDLIELLEIIKASASCAYVDVNTNATVPLNADAWRRLVATGVDAIGFSLDGPDETVNAALRGRGVFTRVTKAIVALDAARRDSGRTTPRSMVVFTIQGGNYQHIVDTLRLLDDLPVDLVFVQTPYYMDTADGHASAQAIRERVGVSFTAWKGFLNGHLYRAIRPEALRVEYERVAALRPHYELVLTPIRLTPAQRAAYFDDEAWKHHTRGFVCPKIYFRTNVYPNGDVVPCTELGDLVLGNVNKEPLSRIWTGLLYGRFRDLLGEGFLPMCHRCCDWGDESFDGPDVGTRGCEHPSS